jgi:hypothetical protein
MSSKKNIKLQNKIQIKKCAIPGIWCGKNTKPIYSSDFNIKYIRKGTSYECLRKGIGVGINIQRNKTIPKYSLKNIKYIGSYFESQFKKYNIATLNQLISKSLKLSSKSFLILLTKILTNKRGILDKKSLNSVILFLYKNGVDHLSLCKKT